MRPRSLAILLLAALAILFAALSPPTRASDSQQAASAGKSGHDSAAAAKDAEPFPQAPRVTAEEVERLLKDGKVVVVDTDDPEAYAAEHIKGAVNITYDPTVDTREADQTLSALPGDRLIVFYCNCPHEEDSAPFVLEMQQLGYDRDKVKALKGGLTRWEQLKYPLAGRDVTSTDQKGN